VIAVARPGPELRVGIINCTCSVESDNVVRFVEIIQLSPWMDGLMGLIAARGNRRKEKK
jgi:hypothetical protein